jgi:hypothetical protein
MSISRCLQAAKQNAGLPACQRHAPRFILEFPRISLMFIYFVSLLLSSSCAMPTGGDEFLVRDRA